MKVGNVTDILDRCPGCASECLYRVYSGERVNFLCPTCSRCWALGADGVARVDPMRCPGCEWRSTCLARWDCDHA